MKVAPFNHIDLIINEQKTDLCEPLKRTSQHKLPAFVACRNVSWVSLTNSIDPDLIWVHTVSRIIILIQYY